MLLLLLRKKWSSSFAGSSMRSNLFFRSVNIGFFLFFVLKKYYDALHPTQARWTYPLSADVKMNCLILLYTSTYYTPHPLADTHRQMRSPGTAPLPFSCHVCCLPMLSCLSLLCMCGLGLYPFSGLVCNLLLWSRWGLSPKVHCQKSISFQSCVRVRCFILCDGHCLEDTGVRRRRDFSPELPRAIRSRPNQGEITFFFLDLRQPQVANFKKNLRLSDLFPAIFPAISITHFFIFFDLRQPQVEMFRTFWRRVLQTGVVTSANRRCPRSIKLTCGCRRSQKHKNCKKKGIYPRITQNKNCGKMWKTVRQSEDEFWIFRPAAAAGRKRTKICTKTPKI